MCRCTPNKRTPFCGAPGCEWPQQRVQGVGGAAGLGPFTVESFAPGLGWSPVPGLGWSPVTCCGDGELEHRPERTILVIMHKGQEIEVIEPLTLWVDASEGERLAELFPDSLTLADGDTLAFTLGDFQVQWFIHGARLREVVDMLKSSRP